MPEKNEEHTLLKEATKQGAELVISGAQKNGEFPGVKSIKDVLPGKVDFYPDLPRVDFDDLLGVQFCIRSARLISEWQGFYGASDFYLLMIELADGVKATTLAGGTAILNQLRKLTRMRGGLPVVVRLTESEGQSGKYKIFE